MNSSVLSHCQNTESPKKKDPSKINRYIDHTILKPDACAKDIEKLCAEALNYGFYSVCVNPIYASLARKILDDGNHEKNWTTSEDKVHVCCTVGFPLGAQTTEAKAAETLDAIKSGAQEIDMVVAVGKVKDRELSYVIRDVSAVVAVCKKQNVLCKVILETCLLTKEEIKLASECCVYAGAHFIKTSTGFSTSGANVDDVSLMSSIASPHGVEVKASGGVRSKEDALKMIEVGATRLGTSSGVKIMGADVKIEGAY